jgi:ATP-dependent Clp protease ATP-binding subunit ClpC
MRLERFTEKAQDAFQAAQEIMQEQHHTQLDVEHVFLAMLRQREGLAARALARLNVDQDAVAQRVERELEKSPKVYGQYGFGNQVYVTPRTQRLVKRAEEEANRLGDQYVGVDHLLIALSGEREGASARILNSFNIDQERISISAW